MLVIREEQVSSLQQAGLNNFENDLIEYFSIEFAPKHCEVIGNERVRKVIRRGIKKAQNYGFSSRGPIRFYLELMFMFGGRFDTDPQYDWVTKILVDSETNDEMKRIKRLYTDVLAYLDKVPGSNRENAIAAFQKIHAMDFDNAVDENREMEAQVKELLKRIYPQKYEFIGKEKIVRVIERGKYTADRFQIVSKPGRMLFIALGFAIGHGFADDLLFPWINSTLTDKNFKEPDERIERLKKKVKIFVSKVLKNLENK